MQRVLWGVGGGGCCGEARLLLGAQVLLSTRSWRVGGRGQGLVSPVPYKFGILGSCWRDDGPQEMAVPAAGRGGVPCSSQLGKMWQATALL